MHIHRPENILARPKPLPDTVSDTFAALTDTTDSGHALTVHASTVSICNTVKGGYIFPFLFMTEQDILTSSHDMHLPKIRKKRAVNADNNLDEPQKN